MTYELVKHKGLNRVFIVRKKTRKYITVYGLNGNSDYHYPDYNDVWKFLLDEVEDFKFPPKQKSAYDIMKEKWINLAENLLPIETDTPQHILFLKQAAVHKVENIDKLTSDKIKTIRDKDDTLGFTEHYLNILMSIAYNEGKKTAEQNLKTRYENNQKMLNGALKQISNIVYDIDFVDDIIDEN